MQSSCGKGPGSAGEPGGLPAEAGGEAAWRLPCPVLRTTAGPCRVGVMTLSRQRAGSHCHPRTFKKPTGCHPALLSHTFLRLLAVQQGHRLHLFIRDHTIHVHHGGGVHPAVRPCRALGLLCLLLLYVSPSLAGFPAALPLLSFALRRWGLSASPAGLPGRAPRPLIHPHLSGGACSCLWGEGEFVLEFIAAGGKTHRGRREGEASDQGSLFQGDHRLVRHNGQ